MGDADPLTTAADRVAVVDGRSEAERGGGAKAAPAAEPSRAGYPKTARGAGAGVPLPRFTSPHPGKTRMIVLECDLSGPAAAGRAA